MSRARTSQTVPMQWTKRTPARALSQLMSLPALLLWRLRCRRELSALTPEQMRDVGLDLEAVRRESRKPFWMA